MRAHYELIIRDYNKGVITKSFALYGLIVLLLEVAEEGLLPSDVAFMLGHNPAFIRDRELLH